MLEITGKELGEYPFTNGNAKHLLLKNSRVKPPPDPRGPTPSNILWRRDNEKKNYTCGTRTR